MKALGGRTRRDRVRELFWRQDVVCSLEAFYRSGELHNGRNEVGPINGEPGWSIQSAWTKHGDGPAHVDYFVARRPSPQLALAI